MIRLRFGSTILQVRRSAAVLGAICLTLCFALIYVFFGSFGTDSTGVGRWSSDKFDVIALEHRLQHLEQELRQNHVMLSQIKETVHELLRDGLGSHGNARPQLARRLTHLNLTREAVAFQQSDCWFGNLPVTNSDHNTYDIHEKLKFDNPDGGVWKQGWNLEYDTQQWSPERKLRLFVIPHSHNDPGWLKTYDKYFTDQTRHILNNMLIKLNDDVRRRFIWAETSFFATWFDKLEETAKQKVRSYLQNGQLEIVTGGWVMNDEANTHIYAMIEQMVEGHQWLENNVGFKPKNGWAIDPFGLSPTMAYLLRRMGLYNMVIQRVHYSVKKHLAKAKAAEFIWRQAWDHNKTTDILCHMMPFYSYDVPHTCGPDPKVCCQFDFKRLPGNKVNCPWKVPPVPITTRNVESRAQLLLDQYRKKAQLFRTNVVLIPLGDDFRYDKPGEWENQFGNYQRLFDYMNSRAEWNVDAHFGTLEDYFTAVREETSVDANNMPSNFPSLVGDFFTYADRDDHYWSGYYTSRPFYKNLDRVVEAHLRGAEILFSLVWARMGYIGNDQMHIIEPMTLRLVEARRNLGLFQHHDAITGTAKDVVVNDYANRLFATIQNLQKIIAECAMYLLLNVQPYHTIEPEIFTLQMDESRESRNTIPRKIPLTFSREGRMRYIVIYNSLGITRTELVSYHVTSTNVVVIDSNGSLIPSQLSPVWKGQDFVKGIYELTFLAEVPAFGLSTYKIENIEGISGMVYKASVMLYNTENYPDTLYFPVLHPDSKQDIKIQSAYLSAVVSSNDGMLKHVESKEQNISLDIQGSFMMYGTRPKGKDRSGAYLFLPDGTAKEVTYSKPVIRVVEGELYSEVTAFLPDVEHHVIAKNSPGMDGIGLEIYNVADVRKETNKELVMRLKTGIQNTGQDFYTDLNGFQIAKRHSRDDLPIQANVYPMPTMMYIQDNATRLTVLSAQSLGTSSLKAGWIDIFLDRRLNQDDNRGLQQGVTDNVQTPSLFRIVLERFLPDSHHTRSSSLHYPSLLVNHASSSLLHPLFSMFHTKAQKPTDPPLRSSFSSVASSLPCDIHLLNLRTLVTAKGSPSNTTAVFLQRIPYDCGFRAYGMKCSVQGGTITLAKLFPDYFSSVVEETTLSLMYSGSTYAKTSQFYLPPSEIVAYKLKRR